MAKAFLLCTLIIAVQFYCTRFIVRCFNPRFVVECDSFHIWNCLFGIKFQDRSFLLLCKTGNADCKMAISQVHCITLRIIASLIDAGVFPFITALFAAAPVLLCSDIQFTSIAYTLLCKQFDLRKLRKGLLI